MTTTQELDSVINALSRTITELRVVKAKLAQSQANEQANLQIKKNLALRINELQKELEAMQAKHDSELKSEQRKTEHFERVLSHMLPFDAAGMVYMPGKYLVRKAPTFNPFGDPAYSHNDMQTWCVASPSFEVRYQVSPRELAYQSNAIPIIRDAIARKMGTDIGEYIRKEVLNQLQEIK